jgi:hypothetical protein
LESQNCLLFVGAPDSPVHPPDSEQSQFPSFPGEADLCSHDPLSTPDSPVTQRIVRCGLLNVGAGHMLPTDCAADRWRWRSWLTGQSGKFYHGSPNFSREQRVHRARQPRHRTLSGAHWTLSGAPQAGASLAGLSQTSPIQSYFI